MSPLHRKSTWSVRGPVWMIVKGQVTGCLLLMIAPCLRSQDKKAVLGKTESRAQVSLGKCVTDKASIIICGVMISVCLFLHIRNWVCSKALPPTPLCCLCIRALSVYCLLLCSLLLLQNKFPHRGNKAELNYTELNWNKRHSTPGSLATASWCKARAGRKCAHTHNRTHSDKSALKHTFHHSLSCVLL